MNMSAVHQAGTCQANDGCMYPFKKIHGRKGSLRRENVLIFKGPIVVGERVNSKPLEKGTNRLDGFLKNAFFCVLGMGTGVLREYAHC